MIRLVVQKICLQIHTVPLKSLHPTYKSGDLERDEKLEYIPTTFRKVFVHWANKVNCSTSAFWEYHLEVRFIYYQTRLDVPMRFSG